MDINRIRNNITNYYKKKKEDQTKYRQKKHNEYWNKYYQDHRWKTLRTNYYNSHPCCEVCQQQGFVVPAEHVHHLHKFSAGLTEEAKFNLLLNPNNLCSVCPTCHRIFHKIMDNECKDYVTIDEVIKYKDQYELNTLNYL